MTRRRILQATVCAATVGFLLGRPATAEPPPDPRLEKIFADWQQRRERIKTVRYRASGEHILPKGSFMEPATGVPLGADSPPHDISWPKSITLLLDFTTSRHRLEQEEQPYGQQQGQFLPKRVTTTVFDSKELWSLSLRPPGAAADARSPDVMIVSGNMRGEAFPSVYWPFFLGHGIVALTGESNILPGRLKISPEKDIYHVHGEGVFANRPCLVLRTEAKESLAGVGVDELWVDSALESAVVRQVQYLNDAVVADIDIVYQQKQGNWLPQSWTILYAHTDGRAISIERMRVDDIEIDPAVGDADFRVEVKPDMIVQRLSFAGSPDQITVPNPTYGAVFHVAKDGSWNEIVNGVEQKAPWSLWVWIVIGVFLLLVAAGAIWGRKRCAAGRGESGIPRTAGLAHGAT